MFAMTSERPDDRLLNQIIVYGFSLSFGLVIASLEALRPNAAGFTLRFSWWTLLALIIGTGIMWPWFRIVMYSQRKPLRRLALLVVVMMGLAAFFYPLRMVPSEKFGAVFIGLGAAVVALSVLASMLIVLYRFFESEGKH
jgi:CDP-diglyceride synthetase